MIQRYNEKLPVCAYCLQPGHTAFKCGKKPQKGLQTYRGLKVSSSFGGKRKPIKKVGKPINQNGHTKRQWLATRTEWLRANHPNHQGYYECHYCRKFVDYTEITLDHKESRSRRPDLRLEHSNLVPACYICNQAKGSLSHDEIEHECLA